MMTEKYIYKIQIRMLSKIHSRVEIRNPIFITNNKTFVNI